MIGEAIGQIVSRESQEGPVEFVDEVTQALVSWLQRVVPGEAVVIAPGREAETQGGITVRLLHVMPTSRPRFAGLPIVLSLGYEVSVRLADTLAAQRALGEIVFAAVARTEYQVDVAGCDGLQVILVVKLARLREIRPSLGVRRMRMEVQPARVLEEMVLESVEK